MLGWPQQCFPLGGVFMNKNKKKMVDINHFHVSLAYANSSVLKATALEHGWLHVQGVQWQRESARRLRTTPRPGQRLQ